jgi:hypothetical protein
VVAAAEAPRPVVVTLPRRAPRAAPATPRPVPEVKGLTVRAAVLALHHAGFRVQLAGLGTAEGTQPEAGQLAKQGTLVRLVTTP